MRSPRKGCEAQIYLVLSLNFNPSFLKTLVCSQLEGDCDPNPVLHQFGIRS